MLALTFDSVQLLGGALLAFCAGFLVAEILR